MRARITHLYIGGAPTPVRMALCPTCGTHLNFGSPALGHGDAASPITCCGQQVSWGINDPPDEIIDDTE